MKSCEYCIKKETCTRDTGFMFGGCNVDFKADTEKIYDRLNNLEGCEDNPVYITEVYKLRAML